MTVIRKADEIASVPTPCNTYLLPRTRCARRSCPTHGIGPQGVGGLTTVLDVKVLDSPTHAASLPVAVIPTAPLPVDPWQPHRGLPRARHGGVYEFEVRDMPVTLAVDSGGIPCTNGPKVWAGKFAGIPLAVK